MKRSARRSSESKFEEYELEDDGILRFHGRMYIPDNRDLRDTILKEAHRAVYCAHPGVKKMYADTKKSRSLSSSGSFTTS